MTTVIRCIIGIFLYIILCSWGFHAHKLINRSAVFTLPSELAAFYKKHILAITEKSVDADKRSYVDSLESTRHYIDIEDFEENHIDSIPIHWSKAKEKYQERKLLAAGIIPWHIERTYQRLVKAFAAKKADQIIKISADLGHYIADAHVPLHTTRNYNGQLSGQIGIHAFWESRIPEMFAADYRLLVGKAIYNDHTLDTAWTMVKESHSLVEQVLSLEKELSVDFATDKQKSYIRRNNVLVHTYSDAYTIAYHNKMNGMVENRMRDAVRRIGAYWFSAWVDAGQPKLDIHSKLLEVEEIIIDDKKLIGREEWH